MSDIGNLIQDKVLLAPLAGITNLPFRLIAREFGCQLCFTEMVSASGLVRESDKTIEYLNTCEEDRPLGVQLFGADPDIMAQAAVVAAGYNPDLLDVNMGCPVRKVVKTGSGAMLMKDPALAGRIIAAVAKATNIPVTVKMRSGWRDGALNAVEMAIMAEESGAAAIIVHGRTAEQGFSGHADWRAIAQVKCAVKIPVVGNGDIWLPQDAVRMRQETGCDAVMVGRGALGNPWIFQGVRQLLAGIPEDDRPFPGQRYAIIKKHWAMEMRHFGERIAGRSFRKHLLWYTRGLAASSRLREKLGKMTESKEVFSELDRYFQSLAASQAEITT